MLLERQVGTSENQKACCGPKNEQASLGSGLREYSPITATSKQKKTAD